MMIYSSYRRFCKKCFSVWQHCNLCTAEENLVIKMPKCRIENKVAKRFLCFQTNPLHRQYRPRLSETYLPPPMWNIFYRQNEAFTDAKDKECAKVFSVESSNDSKCGSRHYVVASLEEFWFYYKQLPTGKRHFYEVIPTDSNCHMYFDLEFNKLLNPCVDGQNLVDLWIEFVSFCLKKELDVTTCRKHVIELDSTTHTKFSQHLIWHIPYTVFKSNLDVGNFVCHICNSLRLYLKMKSNVSTESDYRLYSMNFADKLKDLMVNTSSDEKALFVDEGVYTRNRNFRLYLSSKKNKVTELKLSSKCIFDFHPIDLSCSCCIHHSSGMKITKNVSSDKEKLVFFSSLITNVPQNLNNIKVLEFASNKMYEKKASLSVRSTGERRSLEFNQNSIQLPDGISTDCFYSLHKFVVNYVQQFNENAYVSKTSYDKETNNLFYDIGGTRYCHSIGREHKSNGVFIVINLKQKLCYHRCYDHECRKRSSKPPPFHLPKSIFDSLICVSDKDVSDADLLQAAEKLEKT